MERATLNQTVEGSGRHAPRVTSSLAGVNWWRVPPEKRSKSPNTDTLFPARALHAPTAAVTTSIGQPK
ncbi:hypothetical protein L484_023029 [Morus notabilis]|uniref:Uncharacterized protein n=1 Tax=Morus notabilis TaxID=981085 RepID=W9S9G4_9ROSA|nr:hypothetical protein L484_023029 [Morus notabilis]